MEKNKLTNDQNIINLKKRKYLRYAIIFFAFITIVLALLDLFMQNPILLGLAILFFVITTILNKTREKIPIIKHDELADVKKEIAENKKKFSRGEVEKKEEPKKEPVKKTTAKKTTTAKKKTTTAKKTTNTKKKGGK